LTHLLHMVYRYVVSMNRALAHHSPR
jgi:hypothetical protein